MIPILLLLTRAQETNPASLAWDGTTMQVTEGSTVVRTALLPEPEEAREAASFRRDDRYAVWDERGLTVRGDGGTVTTRLEAYATSPKLFSKEEIRRNLPALGAGNRARGADALSGAVRIGTSAYFLPRWTVQRGNGWGTTWLEALVRVNLADRNPRPELVGRFGGTTTAYAPIDDELRVVEGRPTAIVRSGATGTPTWGLAAVLPATREFGYVPLGGELLWLAGDTVAERTPYGTVILATVDRRGLSRATRLEVRAESVEPLGPEGRIVRYLDDDESETTLADILSGAQTTLPGDNLARPVLVGGALRVLAFDDPGAPTRCWLLAPDDDWTILARWRN